MKVVILAGGLGSRLSEETQTRPKPMVEIGGHPILWHIMKFYASFGHVEFCIALGYKGQVIKDFFLDYSLLATSELSIDLATGEVSSGGVRPEPWKVHLVDTGLESMTGGRLLRLASHLRDETFMMTYGDGLANVDLDALLAFHRSHGKLATVTAVRPPARFGNLVIESDDSVVDFIEKPNAAEGWINGGFFVLEPGVLDYLQDDATIFERDPLSRLAQEGELRAFRHPDFWQCMDTQRDLRILETHWATGKAPWAGQFS